MPCPIFPSSIAASIKTFPTHKATRQLLTYEWGSFPATNLVCAIYLESRAEAWPFLDLFRFMDYARELDRRKEKGRRTKLGISASVLADTEGDKVHLECKRQNRYVVK